MVTSGTALNNSAKTPKFSWDEKISRAQKLSGDSAATNTTKEILALYIRFTKFQRAISNGLSGTDHPDITALLEFLPDLRKLVTTIGSAPLQQAIETIGKDPGRWTEMLLQYWEQQPEPETPAEALLAYLLLQPYAQHMTSQMQVHADTSSPICPACGNAPDLSLLRDYNNGAKRSLLCSLCATEWEFRRVLCPNCGEQHKDKLPVFTAEEIQQARVEACESCKTYIKCIDLSKDGYAIPQVDDLATLALDLWAQEQGYSRQQPNMYLLPSS